MPLRAYDSATRSRHRRVCDDDDDHGLYVALPAWIEADAHDITKPVIAERKVNVIFVRAGELSDPR